MKLQNRIPLLDQTLTSGDMTSYCLQQITKYDEGHSESNIIGVWDSPDGEIDEAAQKIIKKIKDFCKDNSVKPHTMTLRKVKATISLEVVESRSEHYGLINKPKIIKCLNCGSNIHYGDSLIAKHYDTCDRYFCCTGCLAEFEDAVKYSPEDSSTYNKLFNAEE